MRDQAPNESRWSLSCRTSLSALNQRVRRRHLRAGPERRVRGCEVGVELFVDAAAKGVLALRGEGVLGCVPEEKDEDEERDRGGPEVSYRGHGFERVDVHWEGLVGAGEAQGEKV
jgi:hypothetical protein